MFLQENLTHCEQDTVVKNDFETSSEFCRTYEERPLSLSNYSVELLLWESAGPAVWEADRSGKSLNRTFISNFNGNRSSFSTHTPSLSYISRSFTIVTLPASHYWSCWIPILADQLQRCAQVWRDEALCKVAMGRERELPIT